MPRFRGFSTINKTKKFSLTDFDLVKRDLLNHLNIREGELPGRPEFGTRIYNFAFDPNTDQTRRAVTKELERVIGYDPRVTLNDMVLTVEEHGLVIELIVTITPNQNPESLFIRFDEQSQTAAYL
jgi:phage baseplate assembly protein W